MLRELVYKRGRVVTHLELMKAARIIVEQNTVTAHIKAIRDTFRRVDSRFEGICTERGRGYRWTYEAPAMSGPVAESGDPR